MDDKFAELIFKCWAQSKLTFMIRALLTHYKKRFLFEKFYDNLLYNIATYPDYHIKNKNFLKGYLSQTKVTEYTGKILTERGDIRVDLPVWFGDADAINRILIIGLEPRDTDRSGLLNIERVNHYVFATPFALERPRGPYHNAFSDLTNREDSFVYFTDVVKTFHVSSLLDKQGDDRLARQNFLQKAQEELPFLLKELEIIKPTKIVALGDKSFAFLKGFLGAKFDLQKIRHPSQGGAKIAKQQLIDIVQQLP